MSEMWNVSYGFMSLWSLVCGVVGVQSVYCMLSVITWQSQHCWGGQTSREETSADIWGGGGHTPYSTTSTTSTTSTNHWRDNFYPRGWELRGQFGDKLVLTHYSNILWTIKIPRPIIVFRRLTLWIFPSFSSRIVSKSNYDYAIMIIHRMQRS